MTSRVRLARLFEGLIALFLVMPLPLTAGRVPEGQLVLTQEVGPVTLAAFIARGSPPPVPYRAFRRLEARNERTKSEGWIEALTTFDPVQGFSYQILEEGGSGLVRNRVLKSALEAEKRTLNSGGTEAALTNANYVITDAGATDGSLVLLQLRPRRKDPLLMDGFVTVTPSDAVVVRVEGQLSKSPSFWTTHVEIVRRYAAVAGYNVPVELESRAQVRLFGASTFRMRFRYEQVNGLSIPAGEQTIAPLP